MLADQAGDQEKIYIELVKMYQCPLYDPETLSYGHDAAPKLVLQTEIAICCEK
jgi:hypothetical protein